MLKLTCDVEQEAVHPARSLEPGNAPGSAAALTAALGL